MKNPLDSEVFDDLLAWKQFPFILILCQFLLFWSAAIRGVTLIVVSQFLYPDVGTWFDVVEKTKALGIIGVGAYCGTVLSVVLLAISLNSEWFGPVFRQMSVLPVYAFGIFWILFSKQVSSPLPTVVVISFLLVGAGVFLEKKAEKRRLGAS